jgi:hypothetical protein
MIWGKRKICTKSIVYSLDGYPYSLMTVKSFLVNPCMVGIGHSPHTSLLLLFLKAKTERKQILEHWRHKTECDHHIKRGPFGCFQWLLCATSRKMWRVWHSQGRLLWRKIKTFSYFVYLLLYSEPWYLVLWHHVCKEILHWRRVKCPSCWLL